MSTSRYSEKFISKLLDRLGKATAVANLDVDDHKVKSDVKKIGQELENLKKLVPRVKLWEQTLLNQFTDIERGLEKIICGVELNFDDAFGRMVKNVKKIKELAVAMNSMPAAEDTAPESSTRTSQLRQAAQYPLTQQWLELDLVSDVYDRSAGHLNSIRRSYEHLDSIELKMCFLSLSIFPEDSIIKKRPLIYWWIGEGFITSTQDRTAEEVGEGIFENLLRKGLVQPIETSGSPIVNSCKIHHWIRHMLIFVAEEALLFNFDRIWPRTPSFPNDESGCSRACLTFEKPVPLQAPEDLWTVFNVDEQFLDLKREWLTKLKKVAVIQLGRWQGLPTHHIEVEDEAFLEGLGGHQNKHLKYLSLRGISLITELPSCIFNITSLEILDLRACHSLETLPEDISPLRRLTHFDISECYLLDSMPKGIDKLSYLQVLKGYVIGDLKSTPCRIGDFAKLNKLRRLSIHIANKAVVRQGEFNEFKKIESLRCLKISWGKVSAQITTESLEVSFPLHLEKLALQGIPQVNVPKWLNPKQLKNLKSLYVAGGKLRSLDHEEHECEWAVEVLRLKYLSNFENKSDSALNQEFPRLRYLEMIKCNKVVEKIKCNKVEVEDGIMEPPKWFDAEVVFGPRERRVLR